MIYTKTQPVKTTEIVSITEIPQGKSYISVLRKRKTTELFTVEREHPNLL